MSIKWFGIGFLALGMGCGTSGNGGIDSGLDAGDGALADGANSSDAGRRDVVTRMDATGSDAMSTCEPDGHYGIPTSTFVLPAQGTPDALRINYPDIQQTFPAVSWNTLDRLYIPAGSYKSFLIGNLPARDPAHPLVITNQGGQVFVGNNPDGNYIWSIGGGAGWVLTGRYDAVSQTGDSRFPGHRCGQYENTAGTYGFLSDDGFAFMAPYLHMGIGVQDATKFEIEYVEVRRSGFAGIRLLNPRTGTDPAKPMEAVHVHDVYIHDTGAEGFYFGWTGQPPSNDFPGLEIDNCRILRTGNEALQIQDLADGAHVHHNVFAAGGLRWLDNGLGRYQDNNAQITTRSGNIELDHNVFLDGAGSIVSFWSQPETGDGPRHVVFHDNVIGDTLSEGIYFGGSSDSGSSFAWVNNYFRGLMYGYEPITPSDTTGPTAVIDFDSRNTAPIALTGNAWEGSRALMHGLTGGNGTAGMITASGNTNTTVGPVSFVNAGFPYDNPGHHVTSWAPNATVSNGAVVMYHAGDIVADGSTPDFYRASMDTTLGPPSDHPEAWTRLAAPIDDVRVTAGSTYAGMGVR